MEKNLKDYLHLYMGCDVFVFTPESVHDGFLDKYIKDYPNGEYKIPVTLSNIQQVLSNGYLPLLRPLSNMTEAEANDVEWYMWDGFPGACFGNREEILKMFIHSTDKYRPGFVPMVRAINWLRKAGFDVDELIASGLAIDATTIKTQPA